MLSLPLHPAVSALVARMRSTANEAERAAVARMATRVAALSGHSLADAIATIEAACAPWTEPRMEFREQYAHAREAQADAGSPSIATNDALAARVETQLQDAPALSDRAIARSIGCSPTIVGRARKRLGLQGVSRVVRRGGQQFMMRGTR